MRDFRDAKAVEQTLREALKAKSVSLTHGESLEVVAKMLGFHDWNELSARIQSENRPEVAKPATISPLYVLSQMFGRSIFQDPTNATPLLVHV
jgi:hypothetical protein